MRKKYQALSACINSISRSRVEEPGNEATLQHAVQTSSPDPKLGFVTMQYSCSVCVLITGHFVVFLGPCEV